MTDRKASSLNANPGADALSQEIFHLTRRVEALQGFINDQFYTLIQFCNTLPLGGEDLMGQLLTQLAVYHTQASIKSDLFTGSYSLPGKKLSAIEALEFVYGIHVKEKIVGKDSKRIEGNDNKFTVYYDKNSCFYKGHCEALVSNGLSCTCVRRFFYEGLIKVMSGQEYASAIDTPHLDQEFCALTFEKKEKASENPDETNYRISGIIKENLQLHQVAQRKLKLSGQKLEESHEQLRASLIGTIVAVSKAIGARDPYTAGHQQRVSQLSRSIAQEMDLDAEQIDGLRMGASIHDIGKIYLPAEILSKPAELTDIEYELVKSHSQVGYDILKDIEFPWPVADITCQHHERLDGTGYPQGLKGDEICLEARIAAVADVVEAMSSHRPYRPSLGIDAALEEIEAHRGAWFDPAAVDACLKLFREKGFSLQS